MNSVDAFDMKRCLSEFDIWRFRKLNGIMG